MEKEQFLSLSLEEREEYLNEHHLIILSETKKDGRCLLEIETSKQFDSFLNDNKRDEESIDDVCSRIIEESLSIYVQKLEKKPIHIL